VYAQQVNGSALRYADSFEEVEIERSIGIFFPAFNEAENIGPLLDEAVRELAALTRDFEIVVVDDGSSDRTAEIVRSYAERHPQVRLVSHPTNLGYGHALRTGLATTRGDAIALVDGDRQFRIGDLRLLVDRLDEADVVAGYRIVRADPRSRLFIARVYKIVLRTLFGLPVRDPDCGFKLFSRKVVDAITPQLVSRSAFISPEIVIRSRLAGFKIVEVGVPHHPRVAGRPAGATPRVIARTLSEIVRLRRSLGRSRRPSPS
jgi:glycosyltransferase involved in cell wall biosynthesis